jgi:hypothetical protein
MKLSWRLEGFSKLVKNIHHQIQVGSRIGKTKQKKQILTREDGEREEVNPRIPEKLSREVYEEEWLGNFTDATKETLKIKNIKIMTDDFMPKRPS